MKSGANPLTGMDYSKTIFNPRWFMENMLYIVDKRGKLVRFKLNDEQSIMMEHIEFCIANDIPIRMIILKARQIGSTTFFTALGFWLSAMNKNITYGIVAHRYDSAASIFQKCKIFYNNLPQEMQPSTTQFSGEGITFDKKGGKGINSQIKFATVSESVYRGQTMTYLHLSECAFWEGDRIAIENSLSPTVAIEPGTIIVRESTARGFDSFKDDWDRAVRGQSNYVPFFFGWQDHKEYRVKVPKNFVLSEKEQTLKEKFNLDNEQLYWRRTKIETDYRGNETYFAQEYPMTAEEAFVAAGGSVFDRETIVAGYSFCKDPETEIIQSYPVPEKLFIWEQPLLMEKKVYAQKTEWNFEKQAYEYVDTDLLIEELEFKTPYTVSIDTSGMGADFNQIVVTNNITKKLAARFGKKNLAEEMLAKVAVEIAKKYHDALIVPETNYSKEICKYIIKDNGYSNVYINESIDREDQKIVGGIEYGWKTTTKTKPAMISALRARLTKEPSLIQDREFWFEAEYYLMEDPIKYITNAAQGHFDDILIATAIGQYVSDSFQAKSNYQVTKKTSKNQGSLLAVDPNKKKKVTIRKGMYTNRA